MSIYKESTYDRVGQDGPDFDAFIERDPRVHDGPSERCGACGESFDSDADGRHPCLILTEDIRPQIVFDAVQEQLAHPKEDTLICMACLVQVRLKLRDQLESSRDDIANILMRFCDPKPELSGIFARDLAQKIIEALLF